MDSYFKKDIIYPYKGIQFTFSVAHELFSTFAIDHGTDMLLRHIVTDNPKTILDVGCGYGPIGICLARIHPDAQVTMLDADLLAVRYAEYNSKTNDVPNVKVLGSVGVDAVQGEKFDLIVSNIPAKIGDKAIIEEFIRPLELLNPNGQLVVVIVSALNHILPTLKGRYDLSTTLIRKRNGHFLYKIDKLN